MKIRVANLEPNPFRHIDKYPIDRKKVDALKASIKEKTFWGNILVRPHPTKIGAYQLAYGHHRHICLKELGIKEIDVPVRDLSDALMLQIMAEENLDWSTSPAIMTQTILTAKEFLDTELAKYKTWESTEETFSSLFEDERGWRRAKAGVGRDTLMKFLGGNWTAFKVQTALTLISDDKVDQAAIAKIPTLEQATQFHTGVRKYDIPKKKQLSIAKKIAKDGIGRRDIQAEVAKHSTVVEKPKNTVENKLKSLLEGIDADARKLKTHIMLLRKEMQDANVTDLRGVKVWLTKCSLSQLAKEIDRLKGEQNETNC